MDKIKYYKPELEKKQDIVFESRPWLNTPKKNALLEQKNTIFPEVIKWEDMITALDWKQYFESRKPITFIQIYWPECIWTYAQGVKTWRQWTGSPSLSMTSWMQWLGYEVQANRLIVTSNPSSLSYTFIIL